MNLSFITELIMRFQGLVEVVPTVVQPLIISVAGAIPFVEGEVSSMIGVLGGVNPVAAAAAGAAGNFLSVLGVVAFATRVRTAVSSRAGRRREPLGPPAPPSKGRQRFARWLDRFGVPGASLLGPLALPSQLTSAALVAAGVPVARALIWQAAAIVLWTTVATLSATGFLAINGA